jgi:hypothetical protein
MMDAARTASISAMQSQASGRSELKTSTPTIKQEPRSQPTEPAMSPSEPGMKATGSVATSETSLPEAIFVESSDDAAVHEVGAGVTDRANENTEPPILVIENRQQRVGSHIARVDVPQQSGRDNRGYRRLFTHARKS